MLSLEEARRIRFETGDGDEDKPNFLGIKEFHDFDLNEIKKFIDWTPFFRGWGLKGKYPSIFQKGRVGPEAERLFEEAHTLLEDICERNLLRPKGVIGLFPANARMDDIVIFRDDQRKDVIMTIPMLRQQQKRNGQSCTLSLADYLAPLESGRKDYIGSFAVTTGSDIEQYLDSLKNNGDSYNSIMGRLISDRLVEAAAEMMHEWVRKKYWGYDPGEDLSMDDRIKGKYRGIRPAIGYPACPDHCTELYLFELLQVEERIGISLTESYSMKPASSISGLYFSHNASRYFGIGKIGRDQMTDYAKRMGQNVNSTKKRLFFAIDYK